MEALQKNLAAAGGPLSGMDPKQLLQFAMRMMNGQEAGDDIAGELADDMLQQGDEEQGEDAEDDPELLSWLARQRNPPRSDPIMANDDGTDSPNREVVGHGPPTPSSLKTDSNVGLVDDVETVQRSTPTASEMKSRIPLPTATSRKRKAEEETQDDNASMTAPKKRAMRSHDAPGRGGQPKADLPATRSTRSGRTKR